jgi:DNA polymerase III subunit chi
VRVDFYQLSRDPAEAVVPLLAARALAAGERLLVVSEDESQIARISDGLWNRRDSFLAHGLIGGEDDARQPILLADRVEPANGARYLMLADGRWREGGQGGGQGFERTFYLFDDGTLKAARECWVALKGREGLTRHFWRQEGGRWTEAG